MIFSRGWKYRLESGLAYKLRYDYGLKQDFQTEWYNITTDNWLLLFPGYAWDGATKFPDFNWILTPSAIHDALHCAIRDGAIPESMNNLIDDELQDAITGNPASKSIKRGLLKLRGWYVGTATHLVNQKASGPEKVCNVPKLNREITLGQFYQRSGK